MGRFVGNCELRVVAGRGGENFFFLTFFLLTAQVSLQQRAESEERSQSSLGGPGEGMGRSRGSARSWRSLDEEEKSFPPFCRVADSESDSFTRSRTRCPTSSVLLSCFLVKNNNNTSTITSNINNNK